MEIIFKDVMLDKIVFNRENNAVCFEFYSYTGKDIGKIICENVFKLDLNQSIMFDEDLLPLSRTGCHIRTITKRGDCGIFQ